MTTPDFSDIPKAQPEKVHSMPSATGESSGKNPDGLFFHLLGWSEAAFKHVLLRVQLLLIETRDAGAQFGMVAMLFLGAMLVALLAYMFLVLTLVFMLAEWMDGPHVWLKTMGIATGVHVLLALLLALLGKARMKTDVFQKTREEFNKDKLWL